MSIHDVPNPEREPEVSLKWRLAIALDHGNVTLPEMAEAIDYSETMTRNFRDVSG